MAYITREDGEHFVIPSYRDVLTIKQKSQLKKEIYSLSQSYGSYITLQKKSINQYEVAFSNDTGYLLGETIWHQFKRPDDMIFCEAVPNSTEAIFVIVKAGSVYLDGRFPMDSIPEELVVFLTQKNQFAIYVYGDVPLSEQPEEGKFSFATNAVQSFQRLDKPAFATLPLLKNYQLQLVEPTLKRFGVGVFPTSQLIGLVIVVAALWAAYSFISEWFAAKPIEQVQVNPYQEYVNQLSTPDPAQVLSDLVQTYIATSGFVGWQPKQIDYDKNNLKIQMLSEGGLVQDLSEWSKRNNMIPTVSKVGVVLTKALGLANREKPKNIYSVQDVMATFLDRLAAVYPGNHIGLGSPLTKINYTIFPFTLNFQELSYGQLQLIAQQFENLPMVMNGMTTTITIDGKFSGTISMTVVGN